jgi:hypothetical protein
MRKYESSRSWSAGCGESHLSGAGSAGWNSTAERQQDAILRLHALLQHLHALGVSLTPSPDGTMRCHVPTGLLTPALVEAMRQHKVRLHDFVEAFEERAVIAPFCSGFPRPKSEVLAWACVLAEPVHGGCAGCGYPAVTGAP